MADARYLLSEIDLSEYGLGVISPLNTKEIIKIKEENLISVITPFLLEFQGNNSNLKLFNYLFNEDEEMNNILIQLLDSLKIIYRTDDVKFELDDSNDINIIIADASINKNNYDKLCEVICKLFFIPDKKDEKRVIQVSEANRSVLEEYLRLEREHEKEMEEINSKNQKTLHQIVTIIASECFWDYEKVLNMTYYRLINTYMSMFNKDGWNIYMRYTTSGNFDMKNQKQEYWMDVVGK
jgi:hypothetical protein